MYYGIIMIAVLLFSLQFLFNQRFQKEYGSGLRPLLVFVLGYNIAGLLVLLVINGFRVEFTPFTLLLSFLWAVNGLILSFCSFKTTSKWTWIGLDNYVKAFADESFRYSFGYTALYAVVSVILINVLAFAVAYALTQKIRGANLFRTVFFMPNLIGGIVLGYIWSMIFDGLLSNYGKSILTDSTWGFWGLIILMCWQQIGYMMIIYIAGLQSIPNELIEAARIDGATARQTLFQVKIPNVMPSITICMFLTLTNSFKLFDQNLALTGGLPFIINPDGKIVGYEVTAGNVGRNAEELFRRVANGGALALGIHGHGKCFFKVCSSTVIPRDMA